MIKKSTLDFLKKLKKNNNRDWFNRNKHLYEDARYDFEVFVFDLIQKIAEFDESVSGIEPKDCVFRIYRDVRFSKNKSPYKLNFAAAIQSGGRKSPKSGYYLHLQPGGESMLACGIYMPMPDVLNPVRQLIADNYKEYEKIIRAKDFKREFKEVWGGDDKLKTVPKGYPKDHPAAEHLKNKSFIAFRMVNDEKVLSKNFLDYSVKVFKVMRPFNDFINRAV
jgi:uncharacterized protein (TIGR02453 family)